MAGVRRFLLRLYTFLRPARAERELSREVAAHLRVLEEDYARSGMSPDEARRAARRAFGGVDQVKERSRDVRSFVWLEDLRRDLRIGARTLLRRPGFAVSVILTLAIGIGANEAVFSVVHAVLLRPFAYPAYEPNRVLLMAERSPRGERNGVSYPTFRDWVEQLESFEALSGVQNFFTFTLTGLTDPVRVRPLVTSSTYFGIHGIRSLHGRLYDAADDRVGAAPVVVLTHPLWQDVFGARADVVGETIQLSGRGYTVVGVLPPGVDLNPTFDLYTPLEPLLQGQRYEGLRSRSVHTPLYVHGRLRAGVSLEKRRRSSPPRPRASRPSIRRPTPVGV